MSMAIGLPCREGLVICADEQTLTPGGNKSFKERISCVDLFGSALVSSYAGPPELWREATDKIAHHSVGLHKLFQVQTFDHLVHKKRQMIRAQHILDVRR